MDILIKDACCVKEDPYLFVAQSTVFIGRLTGVELEKRRDSHL